MKNVKKKTMKKQEKNYNTLYIILLSLRYLFIIS